MKKVIITIILFMMFTNVYADTKKCLFANTSLNNDYVPFLVSYDTINKGLTINYKRVTSNNDNGYQFSNPNGLPSYSTLKVDNKLKELMAEGNCENIKLHVKEDVQTINGNKQRTIELSFDGGIGYAPVYGMDDTDSISDIYNNTNNAKAKIGVGNTENSIEFDDLDCTSLFGTEVQIIFNNILKIIQYAGPILVAIFTIIDLIKAFVSGDDGELNKVFKKFIKRLIAAALLFFLPILVRLIFEITGLTAPNICLTLD